MYIYKHIYICMYKHIYICICIGVEVGKRLPHIYEHFTKCFLFYIFETIKPGLYLNGSSYRPSHIHFKITPPGFNALITQLYFQGDPYIPTDAAASVNSGSFDATHRIIPLVTNINGDLEGTWDIIIF